MKHMVKLLALLFLEILLTEGRGNRSVTIAVSPRVTCDVKEGTQK